MRLWLTEEEQNNINKQYFGNTHYDHVHVVFYNNEYKREYDLCGNTEISLTRMTANVLLRKMTYSIAAKCL